jgi:hypothetical protein
MQRQQNSIAAPGQMSARPILPRTLLAMVLMLLVTWGSGWWFEVPQPMVLAVSIGILIIGLVTASLASTVAQRQAQRIAGLSGPDSVPMQDSDNLVAGGFSAPLHGKRWTLDVFAAIDAKRFAAVCETWFSWAGFDTRSEAHRTDEGVDIWLHAAKVPGPVAIVRCKHWLNKPVGLQEMKEFLSLMASYKSVHGTYTTTSTYTPEALQFARDHGIDAVDGKGLLRRIQTRTRQRQQALLAVAYNGST